MDAAASQSQLDKFVKIVDEFMQKYAVLSSPEFAAKVNASNDSQLKADYADALQKGAALKSTINAGVGAWNAFKRGYAATTDYTSTVIGDAVDTIRSWFGYAPAGNLSGLGNLGAIQIPAAAFVVAVIAAAVLLNNAMNKIFVSVEASRIQRDNPNLSRSDAVNAASKALTTGFLGLGVSWKMLLAAGAAVYLLARK